MMNTPLDKILFLDIETVSQYKDHQSLPTRQAKELWSKKSDALQRFNDEPKSADELYPEKAAIYAEFGKIVCISVGFFHISGPETTFYVKSFYGELENELLSDFLTMLDQGFRKGTIKQICGHNIKEFDIPYICRRAMIQGLILPNPLQLHGKKPWELEHLIDTMQLWKFGDYKNFTSLKLLCHVFDVPTPKDDMDGSQVGHCFWIDQDVDKIEQYCKKDVIATARLFMKMRNQEPFSDNDIIYKK